MKHFVHLMQYPAKNRTKTQSIASGLLNFVSLLLRTENTGVDTNEIAALILFVPSETKARKEFKKRNRGKRETVIVA